MTSLSKSFRVSSSLKEEVMVTKNNQGIVSILGSEPTKSTASSLRRTLSADMSSKKWQNQHGLFSPLKRIASSQQFPLHEELNDQEEEKSSSGEQPGRFDIWSSILTHKSQEETKNLPTPYIHPLVKRSASSLSEKSLHICTESLGSETGSDGFSSYPPSESSDIDQDDKEKEQERPIEVTQKYDYDADIIMTQNISAKKSKPRSFPPPIPSLSSRDGASVTMSSYRGNGRLVLKAVSVPFKNRFRAERQDGRLVLTFIDSPDGEEQEAEANKIEQFEMELEKSGGKQELDVETEEEAGVNEQNDQEMNEFEAEEAQKLPCGKVNFPKLEVVVNKGVVLANTNTATWSNKFTNMVEFEEEEEEVAVEPIKPITQSLPPRPLVVPRIIPSNQTTATAVGVAAAVSLNPYEYYWKRNAITSTTSLLYPPIQNTGDHNNNTTNKLKLSKNLVAKNLVAAGTNPQQQQREILVLRGHKGDYQLVPLLKSCKEPRRSLLFWEPHCIATS